MQPSSPSSPVAPVPGLAPVPLPPGAPLLPALVPPALVPLPPPAPVGLVPLVPAPLSAFVPPPPPASKALAPLPPVASLVPPSIGPPPFALPPAPSSSAPPRPELPYITPKMRAALDASLEERTRLLFRDYNQVNCGGGAEVIFPMTPPEILPAVKPVLRPVPDTCAIGMHLPLEERPHMKTLRAIHAAAPYTLQPMMQCHGMPSTPTIFDHATGQIRRHILPPPSTATLKPIVEEDPEEALATCVSDVSIVSMDRGVFVDHDEMLSTPDSVASSVSDSTRALKRPSSESPGGPSPKAARMALPSSTAAVDPAVEAELLGSEVPLPEDPEDSLKTCISDVSLISTARPISIDPDEMLSTPASVVSSVRIALKRPSSEFPGVPSPKAARMALPSSTAAVDPAVTEEIAEDPEEGLVSCLSKSRSHSMDRDEQLSTPVSVVSTRALKRPSPIPSGGPSPKAPRLAPPSPAVDPVVEAELLREGSEVPLPEDPEDLLHTCISDTSLVPTARLISVDPDDALVTCLSDVSLASTARSIPGDPDDALVICVSDTSLVVAVPVPVPVPAPVAPVARRPRAPRVAPRPLPPRVRIPREAKSIANDLLKGMIEDEAEEAKADSRALLRSIEDMHTKLVAAAPTKLPANEGGDGGRLVQRSPLLRGLMAIYGKAVAARASAMSSLGRLRRSARRKDGASINSCLSLASSVARGDIAISQAAKAITALITDSNRRVAAGGARYEWIEADEKKGAKAKVLLAKAKAFFQETAE